MSNTVYERISLSNFEKQIEMYLTGYLEEIRLVGTGGRGREQKLSVCKLERTSGRRSSSSRSSSCSSSECILVCKLKGTPGGRLRGEHHLKCFWLCCGGKATTKVNITQIIEMIMHPFFKNT